METGGNVRGRPLLAPLAPEVQHLDTVRALHQTVVALRVALEKSRTELQELRQKVQSHIDTSVYVDTIEKLSLENHVLRQRVLTIEGHNEVPEYALRITLPRETPSSSAATYTLSPVPEAMDSLPTSKNGTVPPASPRDKKREAAALSVPSPRTTPSPVESIGKRSKGPPLSPKLAREVKLEQKDLSKSNQRKATLENGENMAAALEDAEGGDDVEPEAVAAGGGRGSADHADEQEGEEAEDGEDGADAEAGAGALDSDVDGDSEELDDIELIFTTEETKELGVLQEDLVPIADAEEDGVWAPLQFESVDDGEEPPAPTAKPTPVTAAAAGLAPAPARAPAPAPTPAPAPAPSPPPSPAPSPCPAHNGDAPAPRAWARSVLVETDISKCGVVDEGAEVAGRLSRRNTLPAPLGFPPVMLLAARDASSGLGLGVGLGVGLGLPAGRLHAVRLRRASAGVALGGGGGGAGPEAEAEAAQRFPARPILVERCRGAKRESEAQTDITALPAHWRSESALAQKVGAHAFTTLPSKFALPDGAGGGGGGGARGGGRRATLRLADKTQEARRTLLSDINFTSMVPELSRSADHLCGDEGAAEAKGAPGAGLLLRQYPRAFSYMKNADFGLAAAANAGSHGPLVSPGGYGAGGLARAGSKDTWSPCTCACACTCSQHSHCCRQLHSSWDSYSSVSGSAGGGAGGGGGGGAALSARYRGSLSALESGAAAASAAKPRRHSWRAEARSCGALAGARSWGSVPSSPTHHSTSARARPPASPRDFGLHGAAASAAAASAALGWPADSQGSVAVSRGSLGFGLARRAGTLSPAVPARSKPRNRVTFEEGGTARRVQPGQSLPDLRSDWDPDSGDSTDSLIDEAEEYLRRSIDSILTGADVGRVSRRRQLRRLSEPDPIRELAPPQTAQPFLPKVPRDLKLDYFVKVITAEGRVMVGRVRYVGSVPNNSDPFVGVELPKAAGDSDGSFQGRRFFDCDPDYALFVPFKKVVMAWSV